MPIATDLSLQISLQSSSLESLATAVDLTGYWTVNEDALVRDGARASLAAGVGKWHRSDGKDGPIRDLSFNPATRKGAGVWEEAARLWRFEFVLSEPE